MPRSKRGAIRFQNLFESIDEDMEGIEDGDMRFNSKKVKGTAHEQQSDLILDLHSHSKVPAAGGPPGMDFGMAATEEHDFDENLAAAAPQMRTRKRSKAIHRPSGGRNISSGGWLSRRKSTSKNEEQELVAPLKQFRQSVRQSIKLQRRSGMVRPSLIASRGGGALSEEEDSTDDMIRDIQRLAMSRRRYSKNETTSVVKIQRTARMKAAQRHFKQQKASASTIQRLFRWYKRRDTASIVVQRCARRFLSLLRHHNHLAALATRIQSKWRRTLCIREMAALCKAVTLLQRRARGLLARKHLVQLHRHRAPVSRNGQKSDFPDAFRADLVNLVDSPTTSTFYRRMDFHLKRARGYGFAEGSCFVQHWNGLLLAFIGKAKQFTPQQMKRMICTIRTKVHGATIQQILCAFAHASEEVEVDAVVRRLLDSVFLEEVSIVSRVLDLPDFSRRIFAEMMAGRAAGAGFDGITAEQLAEGLGSLPTHQSKSALPSFYSFDLDSSESLGTSRHRMNHKNGHRGRTRAKKGRAMRLQKHQRSQCVARVKPKPADDSGGPATLTSLSQWTDTMLADLLPATTNRDRRLADAESAIFSRASGRRKQRPPQRAARKDTNPFEMERWQRQYVFGF